LQADVGWVEQELNEVRGDCRVLKEERDEARADYALLLESSTAVADNLREDIRQLQSQLAAERASREEVEAQLSELKEELATLAASREELAQLKKEAAFAASEVHRSGRSIELEKVSGLQELSDAKSELKDAQATILKQGDKIRELERGYSFKPNPVESALRLEISELRSELEAYKQQPATELELPSPADLLNQLKTRRKKSTATLADVEKLLEILEEGSNEPD
jgi:DNA repair exonuclease SbcCD ATPase subunit